MVFPICCYQAVAAIVSGFLCLKLPLHSFNMSRSTSQPQMTNESIISDMQQPVIEAAISNAASLQLQSDEMQMKHEVCGQVYYLFLEHNRYVLHSSLENRLCFLRLAWKRTKQRENKTHISLIMEPFHSLLCQLWQARHSPVQSLAVVQNAA